MQPSQSWAWRSTAMTICASLFPRHGSSLSHVTRLIDEHAIESLDERVLKAACELGAPPRDLEFVLSRTAPDWREVVTSAARGGHVHVFRWMRERQDDRGPWEADFYDAIGEAARHGHLELIKWLHERGVSCIGSSAFTNAASHGHLAVLQWLLKHATGNLESEAADGVLHAAGRGHLTTVQWIYETFKDTGTTSAMASAAENGDLAMLEWLHQRRSCSEACSTRVMDAAVSYDHFHVAEWLFENCSKGCSSSASRGVASTGNLPMLQWLNTHFSDRFDLYVMQIAASEGHLETVKWLHEHRPEGCTSFVMDDAARNGHVDVLRWLHENRSEGCTTAAMDGAAAGGHQDIMKWLYENRSEGCSDEAMYEAAYQGHVDVLRWLVEHYPDKCRDDLMTTAAWEGHLDVVRYLDENTKQRASAWGLGEAARQGRLKTLQVLVQQYHNCGDWSLEGYGPVALTRAFEKVLTLLSHQRATPASLLWGEVMEALEFFHNLGYLSYVSTMLERALERGYLALAQQFMKQRGADKMCKYVEDAAGYGNIVLLRWLLANGSPIDMSSVIQIAAKYVEVAGYLSEGDRVQLVRDAVTNKKWRKLLQWTLDNTRFNNESSRVTIYDAIQQAPTETEQWLRENLTNTEACKWCFPFHKRQRVT